VKRDGTRLRTVEDERQPELTVRRLEVASIGTGNER